MGEREQTPVQVYTWATGEFSSGCPGSSFGQHIWEAHASTTYSTLLPQPPGFLDPLIINNNNWIIPMIINTKEVYHAYLFAQLQNVKK